eukprot:13874998-Alexandrium_andersonii.AAC.1
MRGTARLARRAPTAPPATNVSGGPGQRALLAPPPSPGCPDRLRGTVESAWLPQGAWPPLSSGSGPDPPRPV